MICLVLLRQLVERRAGTVPSAWCMLQLRRRCPCWLHARARAVMGEA